MNNYISGSSERIQTLMSAQTASKCDFGLVTTSQLSTFNFQFSTSHSQLPRVESPLDISRALTEEELYRVVYLPFVIAEVVWDFADTLLDIASISRISSTKKLSRAIRQLRQDYTLARAVFFDSDHRRIEKEHMELFQEELHDFFNKLSLAMRLELHRKHGELSQESEQIVCTCYMAMICFKTMIRYVRWADTLIETKCGSANHSIMPDQIRRLGILIPEFAGDCELNLNTPQMEVWCDSLYCHIHSVKFTGLSADG